MEDGFEVLASQVETALAKAMESYGEKIAHYEAEPTSQAEPAVTEEDIQLAFTHIMQGNYYQIPESHLQAVMALLSPFVQYVENQQDAPLAVNASSS
jgi:hypothetical protein